MKAVLVVDIPEGVFIEDCIIDYEVRESVMQKVVADGVKRLKPLPQKLKLRIQREWITDYDRYEIGYNACLDKITGETE